MLQALDLHCSSIDFMLHHVITAFACFKHCFIRLHALNLQYLHASSSRPTLQLSSAHASSCNDCICLLQALLHSTSCSKPALQLSQRILQFESLQFKLQLHSSMCISTYLALSLLLYLYFSSLYLSLYLYPGSSIFLAWHCIHKLGAVFSFS
jgi:hypothetical protein